MTTSVAPDWPASSLRSWGEEREVVLTWCLVEVVERCAAGRGRARCRRLDPTDVEGAFGRHTDARAVAVRRASSTLSRIRTPLGRPDPAKKSPLTPTIVAVEERRFCIAVTRSSP